MRLKDWRGSTTRFLEGDTIVDNSLSKTLRLLKPCDMPGPDGSVTCVYLTLARSRWLTFTAENAGRQHVENRGSEKFAKIGANLGLACFVILRVTCQECKGRMERWLRWPVVWIGELSLKSLEPKPEDGTSTRWSLEISNRSPSGSSER